MEFVPKKFLKVFVLNFLFEIENIGALFFVNAGESYFFDLN